MSTKTKCSIHYLSSLLLSLIFSASCSLHAAIMVTSSADSGAGTLRQALSSVNPAGDEIIFVGPLNITLTSGSLPVIDMSTAGSSLILDGGSSAITIDGSSSAQVFFVQQGDITFQNFTSLSIQNAAASGGMGGQGGGFTSPSPLLGAGGGGALGAGAAIFVNNTATVTMDSTVTQLTLDTNQAAGGTGGIGGGCCRRTCRDRC